ncbi:hypothetical protein CWS01_12260 [Niallia nealsonii]|uniref:Transposase DDE domain-containing protein n=1 Tax=Niallia nealsonii TaxID=115979 RepID=A0A2N0Z1J9_9BACI|nr:hypothetical protein CWS01_12260 [Niallia nealsonii]
MKEDNRQYKSTSCICENCPFLLPCTQSQSHQKLIQRQVWEKYMEEADHLRHQHDMKQIYAKRKETIEREKKRKAWHVLDNFKGTQKIVDAYFRCHKFKKDGELDLGKF